MKSIFQLCGIAVLALGLAACSDEGVNEPGLTTTITAIPAGARALPPDHHQDGGLVTPQHAVASYKTFRRADGVKIDLQVGLINLVPLRLQACATLAVQMDRMLRGANPLATAHAHTGHEPGDAPAAAVDVLAADGTRLNLGSLVATPGRYCGVEVALVPGATQVHPKHGDGLDTTLDGVGVNVSPCYYPTTAGLSDADAAQITAHSCGQARVVTALRTFTVEFPAPVTLDAAQRSLDLALMVRYQEWFDGVDLDALTHSTDAGHAAAVNAMVRNIGKAIHAVPASEQNVAIGFEFRLGGAEAVCGATYDGLGSTAQPLQLEDYRFYASDIRLQHAGDSVPVRLAARHDGTVLQNADDSVALLGYAQGCSAVAPIRRLSLAGTAPHGDYDQICFTVGLPFSLNHSDVATAPAPLDVAALARSRRDGRVFFRFDAKAGLPEDARDFSVHLNSTGCSNTAGQNAAPDAACLAPNLAQVCLDYADIATGAPIVVDLAPAISELDITHNTADTAPGCASSPDDPECTSIIPQFGLDLSVTAPRRNQTVFTVGPADADHGA